MSPGDEQRINHRTHKMRSNIVLHETAVKLEGGKQKQHSRMYLCMINLNSNKSIAAHNSRIGKPHLSWVCHFLSVCGCAHVCIRAGTVWRKCVRPRCVIVTSKEVDHIFSLMWRTITVNWLTKVWWILFFFFFALSKQYLINYIILCLNVFFLLCVLKTIMNIVINSFSHIQDTFMSTHGSLTWHWNMV